MLEDASWNSQGIETVIFEFLFKLGQEIFIYAISDSVSGASRTVQSHGEISILVGSA